MSKKRTTLDSLFDKSKPSPEPAPAMPQPKPSGRRSYPGVKQQTVYVPEKVHEQLRRLAFEERAKMHDYLLEGLDLVFAKRGLPSIAELRGKVRDEPKN
jgi:hypothetical protein